LRKIAGAHQQDLSRHLDDAEASLRAALDVTDDGILMLSADGLVLSANNRFSELWQLPRSLVAAGQADPLPSLARDRLVDPDRFLGALRQLNTRDIPVAETLSLADGRVVDCVGRAMPLGREAGRIWCFRDVSAQARANTDLAAREEHYRVIVNQVTDGIDLVDVDTLCFLEVNEAACRMLGYRRDELIGKSMLAILATPNEAALRAGIDAIVRKGQVGFEDRQRCKDGRVLEVFVSARAIRLHGRTCLVSVWRDIGARKAAKAELERHRQHLEELVQQRTTELLATEERASRILDSAADGLYGVDSRGVITFINPAACRMLGCGATQAIGRSAHDLFQRSRADGSPYPADESPLQRAWQAGTEWRADDETYWRLDGGAVPVALASHPMIDKGRVVGAVVSVVNVSAQRAAAQARELALLAAEKLAQVRSEFLSNMSHEIRTPMNGVLGFARIGRRNHHDPDKAFDAFDKILTSGNQLLAVVNDILDFSKIDAGKLEVERTSMAVHDVLDGAMQLVADRARAKGLDLRHERAADLPASSVGDPVRLGQVLLNLLANAVKFTEFGRVTLSASRVGDELVFRVADTGIGMSTEQLRFIFDPFAQADSSTTRKFGGTGLGLAICKRLLELMQGDIRVETVLGGGSTFEVRLPYLRPDVDAIVREKPPTALPDKPFAGLNILLAEDDELNQAMLTQVIEEGGARPTVVGNGALAVRRVILDGPRAYDLVLMDTQMPVMDGYEATRRILMLAPSLPIIGQTAHAFKQDRDQCLAMGMAGYISKPIDQDALTRLVLQVISQRREGGRPVAANTSAKPEVDGQHH
jgi:hypothetical protein